MKSKFQKKKMVLTTRSIDYFEYLTSQESRPAIIFLHDALGMNDYLFEISLELGEMGFQIFLPDLYSQQGAASYCLPFLFNSVIRDNREIGNEKLGEIHEIVDSVMSRPEVISGKIGIIGQCLTGGFILHMAIRPEVKAPVVFHHSFGVQGSGIEENCAKKINQPVQGHFSRVDPLCPAGRVNQLQKQLGNHLIRYDYWLPHGIPHLLKTTVEGQLALSRMKDFFRQQLILS